MASISVWSTGRDYAKHDALSTGGLGLGLERPRPAPPPACDVTAGPVAEQCKGGGRICK